MAAGVGYLEGGPCGGHTHKLSVNEEDTQTVVCKGGLYKVPSPVRHHHGDLVFTYRGKVKTGGPSPNLNAPHALGGWKALRKSINHGMPKTLAHSQHVNAATLRTLHRARKVKF